MSFLDRLRGPGPKALRDAGPPTWQVIAAVLAGGLIDVVLAVFAWRDLPLVAYVLPPFFLTLAVAVVDRAGLPVRRAIAWVGLEQRRRWTGPALPTTAGMAGRWLADPPAAATPFERASVLMTAGRGAEAVAELAGLEPATALDAVRLARLRASAAAAADPKHELDLGAVRAAAAPLPPEEARYHVLSAAWTRAWLDISRKRPWRDRFAPVAAELGPYELPARLRGTLVVQQFAGPIASLIAGGVVLVAERLL